MRSDNGPSLELAEVYKAVDLSDVLVLGFLHLSSRLLFDVRTRPGEGPLIRFVPPVRTPDERFTHLRSLRPGFNDPRKYVFIRWPLGVESLVVSEVWQHITDHCVEAGDEVAERECAALLKRLYELDRREDLEAIRGATYRSLWPATRA